MNSRINVRFYEEMQFDFDEIRRYAGIRDSVSLPMIKECVDEVRGRLSYRICFVKADISELNCLFAKSSDLERNLTGCSEGIVFAGTVGLEIDRIITKYSRVSPSKALIFQAIGTERIETLCNVFNDKIKTEAKERGLFSRPRFSPGYGDFPVTEQKKIFDMLDCPRKIGLTLNDSFIMSPSKSVTAIIGLSERPGECVSGCAGCNNTECTFRR